MHGPMLPALALQGFSTGLPERLQLALLHSLPGLENCKMLRPAYAGGLLCSHSALLHYCDRCAHNPAAHHTACPWRMACRGCGRRGAFRSFAWRRKRRKRPCLHARTSPWPNGCFLHNQFSLPLLQ